MRVLLILLGLFMFNFLVAQEQDTTTINLDEIVIAENRIQLPFAAQSRSITLLDRELLQATPVISVADALRYAGGVDVRTRGVHGVQADIGIRGGTFDQTLILFNGIKLNDPQTGHHAMNLPVDLSNVERIEVLKGPGARTFGQNAFAGAVNIVSKTPRTSYLKAGISGGDFGLWGGRISGAYAGEKQAHYAAVNYDRSEGYTYNTDYQMINAFYNGSITLGQGKLDLMGGYTDRAFGANAFYSPNFPDQYEEIQTALAALAYKTAIGQATLEARAYYRQNNDDFTLFRENPELYNNIHQGRTIGFEVNTVLPSENATTGIGIDINKVSLESNNLGNRERFVATLFAEHRMELFRGRFNITPGVQLNNYSDFGFNALPGIDMGYKISDDITVFGNVGYTYRVPTFTDLYYTDPSNLGNPDLQPEFAWNYEVGVKTSGSRLFTGQLSLFLRDGRDMIDWISPPDTVLWTPVNVLELRMTGIDMNGSLSLKELFNRQRSVFSSFDLAYTFIEARAAAPENGISRYALENLRHQVRLGATLQYGPNITHLITYSYYDRANLDDYGLWDTRINYQQGRLGVFVDVTNIFDVEYRESNFVIMPGRWFKMGMDLSLF